MRRHLFDLVLLTTIAAIATGAAIAADPHAAGVALHIDALVLGALVLIGVVASAGDAAPVSTRSRFDRALAERAAPNRLPATLERMEREVILGAGSARDFHFRLRPDLREIARARLEQRGQRPSAATLGRWWEILRPDAPLPEDRFAPGISADELRQLVTDLERLR